NANLVGKLTTSGTLTEYALGTSPTQIINGGDGNLYVAESGQIVKFAPSNPTSISVYAVNSSCCVGFGLDANGLFWFTAPEVAYMPNGGGTVTTVGLYQPFITSGGIVKGPDGDMWATDQKGNQILQIGTQPTPTPTPTPTATPTPTPVPTPTPTPVGALTQFAVPSSAAGVLGITSGSDGALWFTEAGATGRIGRTTTAGVITEYPLASYVSGGTSTPVTPGYITGGPTGQVWYSTNIGVGYMSTAGDSGTNIPITANGQSRGMAYGPDGNIYDIQTNPDQIIKVTPSGTVTTVVSWGTQNTVKPRRIIVGPDNNLWFAEYGTNKIGKLTTGGTLTEYPISLTGNPIQVVVAANGFMWFDEVETGAHQYMKLKTDGTFGLSYTTPSSGCCYPIAGTTAGVWGTAANASTFVQFVTPGGTFNSFPLSVTVNEADMTVGPDGNIWATDALGTTNTIDRFWL
ncbi:MAG: hypothetical protein JOZ58_19820, partial [Acetobacteraceae bacterium]|nr:hypothetical protein [Acetobacteraceae bacterium]